MTRLLTVLVALLVLPAALTAQDGGDTLAFPGAKGWGATADGGSVSPTICIVSNGNDTGAGSYRSCAELSDQIIVFNSNGLRVDLVNNILFGSRNHILGQTGQGDVIIYRTLGSAAMSLRDDSSLVISYLSMAVDSGSQNQDNCNLIGQSVYIYLHYTGCYGHNDEAFDISSLAPNDTIRHISIEGHISAFTDSIHKGCFLVEDDTPEIIEKVSVWKNAGVLCGNRAPWLAGGYGLRFDNYMMYCPSSRRFETPKESRDTVAFVRGYYKNCVSPFIGGQTDRLIQIKDNFTATAGVYFPPNTFYSFGKDTLTSAWLPAWCDMQSDDSDCGNADTLAIALSSWPAKFEPPIPPPSNQAIAMWDTLITQGKIGRWRYMSCEGVWIEKADTLLRTALKQTRDSTVSGLSDWPGDHEDWLDDWPPVAEAGDSACTNADSDGLPDRYEILTWGNTTTSDGTGDQDSDDFLDVIEYAFGYDPTVFTNPDGTEGGGSPSTTHSSGLDVHLCARSAQGGRRRHLYTCVDSAAVGSWILRTDGTEGLFFNNTGTALAATSSRLDSAQVDSICSLRHWRCPPIKWWNASWPNDRDWQQAAAGWGPLVILYLLACLYAVRLYYRGRGPRER